MILRFLPILLLFIGISCKNKVNQPDPEQDQRKETSAVAIDSQKVLKTIAFGSCNREDLPQPMWQYITANNPQLWIWLGDNIYGDSENLAVLKSKYDQQLANPDYKAFKNKVPMIGIWDDHDYGVNDGGKDYPSKRASKQLMLDFLDVPKSAPQRKRDGAYSSYTLGPKGKAVKIILLDARWFRDDIVKVDKVYQPNETGNLLGESQWKWLENELSNSTAQVHIIGCGIQMIPEEHRFEKWANFPKERERLFKLLEKERPPGLLLISGDRHIGEISKYTFESSDYSIYEMTSSGLTHSYESAGDEPNKYRIGSLTGTKNFGLIQIDWDQKPPAINVQLRGLENVVIASENLIGQ